MEPDKQGFFKETQQLVEEYIQERLLLLKYQTAERTAGIGSSLLLGLCLGLLSLLVVLLISALGVYFFAQITRNWYLGFIIITALYAVFLFIVYMQRKILRKYFSDLIISLFFSDTHELNDGEPNK
ncbi:MAG: hypothetical protein INR73_15845 [Williamsia sp.]|nr:hypothetical protein [Williamsia sp.]